ncbi:IdgA domain protein [Aureobasidium melanogenum CBS 110374]|uniref:IdgA domain protein n=1 Tax=Aureobasidium melanogenum (strain CBS 110374) TaxID=1043003 RepID=A0A074VJZ7_AURM1|nr:IdgA domain protein [Aureobasidium melanogenum CBS 110374]KEQ59424.1 IdgA domain protein [Aureobasidium melanogenum CBS 110374]
MFRLRQSALSSRTWRQSILSPQGARKISSKSPYFRVSEEVQQAIHENRPVVALESTIYTHGFPYPDNIALASQLESIVRAGGGVPATIGILDGIARVGLDAEEVVRLAGAAGKPDTLKISRRDLGFACGMGSPGRRYNGGTTVAGTMILAHLAGIQVFATGGLGGVHRGAESTMDISADLTELGRTPVAVVSSGCKSFLDIGRTLEYLETQGVPVATFADGRDGKIDFPAFWTRESGIQSPMVLDNEKTAAAVIHAHKSLGLQSGLLFANPIPEAFSIAKAEMDKVIDEALQEAAQAGATGAANTPFILAKIKDLTGKNSVKSNQALIENNVRRGTSVAAELMKLQAETEQLESGFSTHIPSGVLKAVPTPIESTKTSKPPSVFVAGALAVDFSCDYAPISSTASKEPALHTSNPAKISQSLGGVAHNVARAANLVGDPVRLCSSVGDDLSGRAALDALTTEGLESTGIKTRQGSNTAQYVAVNDASKDLVLAMADMNILDEPAAHPGQPSTSTSTSIDTLNDFWLPQLQESKPTHLVLDANWQPTSLARWLEAAEKISAHVAFEPVSTAKAPRIFQLPQTPLKTFPNASIHLSTPNSMELSAMYAAASSLGFFERQDWWAVIDSLGIPSTGARVAMTQATNSALVDAGIPQQTIQLLPFIPKICVKLGADGVLLTQVLPAGDPRLQDPASSPYILSRCFNLPEKSSGVGGVYMRLFPAAEKVDEKDIVSVNGVGDTFLGTIVAGLAKRGKDAKIEELIDIAQKAAVLTLKSKEAVSPELSSLRSLL